MSTRPKLLLAMAVTATLALILRASTRPPAAVHPDGGVALDVCTVEAGPTPLAAVLSESSGIARTADGSLWTHNDGPEARLYRLAPDGSIEQTVQVGGATALDIEDIDAGSCPNDGGECLWLADTGDNDAQRDEVALFVVRVPAPTSTIARATRIAFSYPEGPRDSEALAVLAGDTVVAVTKGRDTPIEAYLLLIVDGQRTIVRAIARVAEEPRASGDRITGGGATDDGRWIALRSNTRLTLHRTEDLLAGDPTPALTHDLRPLREAQGEGVDITADGAVWLISEGEAGTPTLAHLRCTLPE